MVFSGAGDDMSEATLVFAKHETDAPNSIATRARLEAEEFDCPETGVRGTLQWEE